MKTERSEIRPLVPVLLLGFALAESLLSLFQWMELVASRSGAHPICNVNEVLNCEAVWNSEFATRIHKLTLLPVAGLGLVWGLVAFGLSAVLVYRLLANQPLRIATVAVRLTAGIGALSCITFAVASARAHSLCLTCLGTYLIVVAFGVIAQKMLPGEWGASREELTRAGGLAVGFAVLAYAVLVGPGMATPDTSAEAKPLAVVDSPQSAPPAGPSPLDSARGERGPDDPLARYLRSLPPEDQQDVAESLAIFKSSPTPPLGQFTTRFRWGPENAPVKVVDFTDIRCPHCKHLEQTLAELRDAVPAGSLSIEPRQFPLDGECNPVIAFTDGTHVRCTAAKALICLEGSADFWRIREKLFAEQDQLTQARVLELASSGSLSRKQLEGCIASPETKRKLSDDLAYAMQFKPEGTPLVLLNGRQATQVPAFLYAMTLTGANPDAPAFGALAPPRAQTGP